MFFISGDEAGDGLVFLRAEDNAGSVHSVVHGEVGGRPAAPHEALVHGH